MRGDHHKWDLSKGRGFAGTSEDGGEQWWRNGQRGSGWLQYGEQRSLNDGGLDEQGQSNFGWDYPIDEDQKSESEQSWMHWTIAGFLDGDGIMGKVARCWVKACLYVGQIGDLLSCAVGLGYFEIL